MKKILLSTIVLTAFGLSLILVQLSCKKDSMAAQIASYVLPIASITKLGGVMVDGTTITINKEGKITAVPTVVVGPEVPAVVEFNEIIYCHEEGINDYPEFWKVNMNGTGNQRIPIALPANLVIDPFTIGFKRTTTKIIFGVEGSDGEGSRYLYTCNLDGTGLQRVLEIEDEEFVL